MNVSKKINLVFCTDGIHPKAIGGMQKHSRLLIEELSKNELLNITVIHPHKGESVFDNPAVKEIAIEGNHHKNYIRNCYLYSKSVFSVLKDFPDAHIYSQGLSVWYGAEQLAGRLIINPHGLEPYQTLSTKDYFKTAIFRGVFNKLFNKATKVISLGGRLSGILKSRIKNPQNKIVVIPNAVNLPLDFKADVKSQWKEPFHFLFVGRFAFNKGIEDLLQCAEMLNKEGFAAKVKFSLVGKGPLYEKLKEKYPSPNIYFAGFADDAELQNLYASSDMFILPTLFEGMPTVVLEAMAEGLAIAVTDVGATTELVDEKNGYIINRHDPASIKEAILDFISKTDEQRSKMSAASIHKVKENFTWKRVAELHIDLFKEMSD